ncbi:zinc metalloproteinase nas-13 [Aplysia californica]|uniref:Metalloendopeptidase n=1 Tax=Aplysia californica TaxID=6500 RepID=A0ABM0JPH0_APLCA|nr:zinc metalloproteinase nas-13 [Aplysia californica]
MNRHRWAFGFYGVLATFAFLKSGEAMTSDKQIVNSATHPSTFNFFHLMPGGDVELTVEYDVLLSLEEYRVLHGSGADSTGRLNKRKAARPMHPRGLFLRWKKCVVYYEIDPSLDAGTERIIREAMDEWEKYTCLVFKMNTSITHRIQFKDGDGCKSKIGMQKKPQPLLLARGCRTKGIIAHEIGHAIGFFHEHMRPDRDEFIHVNFDVIKDRFKPDFKKYSTNYIETHGTPYDYTSLMHYGNVIPGSILTLDPKFQDRIGQREGLSFQDIALANKMYNCSKMFCKDPDQCPKGGFKLSLSLKGKMKCQCWCDSGDLKDPLVLCSERTKVPPSPRPVIPSKPPPTVSKPCFDLRQDCAYLKEEGKCMSSMELMMDYCAKTCKFCGKGEGMCMDHEKSCPLAASAGLCIDPGFKHYIRVMCPGSCGLCEKPPNPCHIQQEMMGSDFALASRNRAGRAGYMPRVLALSMGLLGLALLL